ncbi:MAG TPA: MarR family winged helix-turn-helix transcriptional regulator [Woeseiaceae bacterium]|nr:MarR family winged helix-turn-helix transcriptional regulator [Woeseiaceae bacterium]
MMSSRSEERTRYVGASMRLVWQWIWAQNFGGIVRAGYDDLNPAHVGLFRHPTLEGLRLTDIAQRMQITKQSVHELVGHLEARGYLVREPDPADRRARIVVLTQHGRRLETVVREQARQAEEQIAAILGPRRFTQLQQALETLIAELPPINGELQSST